MSSEKLYSTLGHPFLKALIEAGVISKNASRVVIDMPVDGVIKIYEERLELRGESGLADSRVLSQIKAGVLPPAIMLDVPKKETE